MNQSVFYVWLREPWCWCNILAIFHVAGRLANVEGVSSLLRFRAKNRVKETVQRVAGNKARGEDFHWRTAFFTPNTDDDDTQHDTGDHRPARQHAVDQQTGRQQHTELALWPTDKLNQCARNRPNHQAVCNTRLRPGLNGFGIHTGHWRNQILRKVTDVSEPDDRNGNHESDQRRE